jgi:hypothetical protein
MKPAALCGLVLLRWDSFRMDGRRRIRIRIRIRRIRRRRRGIRRRIIRERR